MIGPCSHHLTGDEEGDATSIYVHKPKYNPTTVEMNRNVIANRLKKALTIKYLIFSGYYIILHLSITGR